MSGVRPGYARLRKRAAELLTGISGLPVDLEAVARRLGAEIRLFDLEPDVSGVLYRDGTRQVIVVNQSHSSERRRFTIAHELGHLALHKGEPVHVDEGFHVNFRDLRSATAENVEEVEANAFAANLLMPADRLRADLEHETFDLGGGDETLERLAKRYGVSKQAMAYRLAALRSD